MATKKYLSLERLADYDELIKAEIKSGDESTLSSAKSYTDTKVSSITNGDVIVKEAEHATNADLATNAANATNADSATKATQDASGNVITETYETKEDAQAKLDEAKSYTDSKTANIPTGALASKDIVSESDLDSALAEKVNAAAEGNHSHSNKTVLDGITSAKVSAWDSAEDNAKAYADEKVANLLDNSTEAVDSVMELAEAMKNNADAIEALEGVAASKVPTSRKINGKELSSDITLSASDVGADANGSASAVQTNLDNHIADGVKHITSTERTNWNAAKTHADSAHAPSNAQENVIESIKVNGATQIITSKSVDITVPTDATDIGAAPATHGHAISDITDLQTTLNNAANAISTNTGSIEAHTARISALETKVGDGFEEITSADIQALFNK